jgi:hypothetical protein
LIYIFRIRNILDIFIIIIVLWIYKQVKGGFLKNIQVKIIINIMLDFAVGLVLFLGDITDSKYYKDFLSRV